ncbi:ATP-dependent DNA ligase [Agromyces humi]|uniref:ATP-dependent DNA ligase n=1 Tax=Agromyces humi TaxID=1766800 RepID=UPI00135A3B20|nr:ATP-dependent DNA ligase [Agromyces humi]
MELPDALHPPFELALARPVTLRAAPKVGAGWSAEPKWDGFRTALASESGAVTLWSRQRKNLTRYFPEIVAAAAAVIPDGCVVDGEIVAWRDGRLDFDDLQQRLGGGATRVTQLTRTQQLSYVAFDLLAAAGRDIREVALTHRRALLEQLADGWPPPLTLSPSTTDPDEADDWFKTMPAVGVEGLMLKDLSRGYPAGRRDWLKLKHRDTVEVIAGAVIGSLQHPREVIIGMPQGGRLRVTGRSTTLDQQASRALAEEISPPAGEHPWPNALRPGMFDRFAKDRTPVKITLIEPIVVEVSADVATSGGSFRHSVRFVRARPDVPVEEVGDGRA